jgi:putative transcriptional regulator
MAFYPSSLAGSLLISMPQMPDPRFHRAVIFMISHDSEGAMGIVINHQVLNMTLGSMLKQFDIEMSPLAPQNLPVFSGGPVEMGRGFLLHTTAFQTEDTLIIDDMFGISGTLDALKDVADGKGPQDLIFALGYAGWGPNQLEEELKENAWLTLKADYDLVFASHADNKWERALWRLGINPSMLSLEAGRA